MSLSGAMTYRKVGTETGVASADPHRLIQMLIDGGIEKIVRAKYYIQKNQVAEKGEYISWAISIIGGLQASLDQDKGGEIAANLSKCYDYCTRTLLVANINNDVDELDNVLKVMQNIKEGWDGIREDVVAMS